MTITLAQRVDALESDVAIKELRSKYCWYAARGDIPPIIALFTLDCRFEGPIRENGRRDVIIGRSELLPYFTQSIGKPGLVLPLIVNHVVSIRGDDATGTCAMESAVSPLPGMPALICYYYDQFKRIDAHWYFSYRQLSLYRPQPQLDPNEKRGVDGRIM
jgi:hypothetical protein